MKRTLCTLVTTLLTGFTAFGIGPQDKLEDAAFLSNGFWDFRLQGENHTKEPGESSVPETASQTGWYRYEPQKIGNLDPGGIYTLRFYATSYQPIDSRLIKRAKAGLAIYTGDPSKGFAGLTRVASIESTGGQWQELTYDFKSGTVYYLQICTNPRDYVHAFIERPHYLTPLGTEPSGAHLLTGIPATYEKITPKDAIPSYDLKMTPDPVNGVPQKIVSTRWVDWTAEESGFYRFDTAGSSNEGGQTPNTLLWINYAVGSTTADQNAQTGSLLAATELRLEKDTTCQILVAHVGPAGALSTQRTTRLKIERVADTKAPEVQLTKVEDYGLIEDPKYGLVHDYTFHGLIRDNGFLSAYATVTDSSGNVSVIAGKDKGPSKTQPGWTICEWEVSLQGGTNKVQLYAVDQDGNESNRIQKKIQVTEIQLATLKVTLAKGTNGTVSGKKGAYYAGEKLNLRAVPKPGYIFTGWTGNVTSSANPLRIEIRQHLQLEAQFRPSPFLELGGRYYGAFQSGTTRETNGNWSVTMSKNGVLSGTLLLGGKRVPFKGALNEAGTATLTVKTGLKGPIAQGTLSLAQDFSSGEITGTLTVNGISADLTANKLPVYATGSRSAFTGRYTLALQSASLSSFAPQGTGYATGIVAAKGAFRLLGKLADGSPFAISVPLNHEGKAAIGAIVPAGYLTGTLQFTEKNPEHDLTGRLSHVRMAKPDVRWSEGFTMEAIAIGSRYQAPVRKSAVLEALTTNGGLVSLHLGETGRSLNMQVSATHKMLELPPSTAKGKAAITTGTGFLSGTFLDTSENPAGKRTFQGVILQKQAAGAGFYLTPLDSEPFRLEVAE